jgi:polysaccharide deacetylase family protein (PEP-CTERM system associated)
VTATFFVLGWIAERLPGLVEKIAVAGHEVASHGWWHQRVCTQDRDEFREDIRDSKALLEDLTGAQVLGYRAPSFSIAQTSLWAFDELHEAGYRYDSSVFPIRHDLYGMPFWPRFPFYIERLEGEGKGNWVPVEGSVASDVSRVRIEGAPGSRPHLLEVPITTLEVLGKNVPIAGGGYFRLFPYALTRWGLRRINRVENQPFAFYLHPWEIDPDQPRIEGIGLKSRFRHYLNLAKTESRFKRLLTDFRFASIREHIISPREKGYGTTDPELCAES